MTTEGIDEPEGPLRFLVDDHLKRLARWLRSAGFDAAWSPEMENRELYRRSWVEKRTILTMDRKLWAPRLLRLASHDVSAQFRQVVEAFALDPYERAFTRCVVCNVPLDAAAVEEVADLVPPKALARYETYQRCATCERVFWRGTHTTRTLAFFRDSTGREPPPRFAGLLRACEESPRGPVAGPAGRPPSGPGRWASDGFVPPRRRPTP